MQAVVYEKYGSPDVLRVKAVEKPQPTDDETLIKVHAAEVTKADCEMRNLDFQVKWLRLPMRIALGIKTPRKQILGGYFAGEVDAVGKNVAGFKRGDHVFGAARLKLGAHAEYLCLPASYTIVPKPRNASFVEAAAAPLGGLNALHFLGRAAVQKGESVLINGAGGSIGIFGVQIAKALGARVTAVDGPHKADLLRRIGADHFIDFTKENFATNGRTYDVVFNMVANRPFIDCIGVLNPKGRYLMANPKLSDMLRAFKTSLLTDKKAIFSFAGETREELTTIKQMIEQGRITPVVDTVYSLEQAADAHRRVETEQRLGAVILSTSDH
jgi:NADPH:quinone reductase-like Zn-dependent oxidoreductase